MVEVAAAMIFVICTISIDPIVCVLCYVSCDLLTDDLVVFDLVIGDLV